MQQQSVAEIVGAAVVGEAIGRVCSYLIGRGHDAAGDGDGEAEQNEERLEVALLRIQAAVEEADGWHITNRPLVRWRDKLKRAADDGERVLTEYRHRRRRRVDNDDDDDARRCSLPRRVARLASEKLFAFAARGEGGGDEQLLTVRRFERLADGVGDFVKLVEIGGRAKRFVPFQPLAATLLARRSASCSLTPASASCRATAAAAHAFAFPDLTSPPWRGGPRAHVVFLYADGATGEKLELFVELAIAESADVMALALSAVDALPPHFRFASAAAFGSFHRLHAHDMTSHVDSAWDAHYCSQPSRYEKPDWMAAGYGAREPASVASLPEHVLYVVAEWDSPAAPAAASVHVSYHLGRQGEDSPVGREEMAARMLDGGFGTRARRVERFPDAGAETFDGLVMSTVEGFRWGSGPPSSAAAAANGKVVRWCFVSGWVVYLSVRGVGAGQPYEVGYHR
uniref:Disease resistance N-terminal domain-containing protein n=1 Tax=Leersia perrieri TaxID=77586 RepID=A0A0D9XRW3_9ORYZ